MSCPTCGHEGALHHPLCPVLDSWPRTTPPGGGHTERGSLCASPESDEWVLTYEKAGSLHIGPSEVTVDGSRYYAEGRVVAALASAYTSGASVAVAYACDEILDPSGRLLGLVREATRV